ncbi:MAG: hypothetical protein MJK12_12700 [Colwellia sp.]|nr:hypothetical protein [Colwellia sp.]
MVDKEKLSKDFEEQIQSLAGDIYIQVEEKVSSMVTSLVASQELTNEKVELHTHYISLKESQQKTQIESEQEKKLSAQQLENAKKEQVQLNEKLVASETEIKNLKEVNGSKQSDSEVVLKEKLDEISALNIKLEAFIKQEPVTIEKIAASEKQIQELVTNKAKLEQSEATLIKSDSAKVVALDLQSRQISELQLQVNNANSELEQAQLEQSKLIATKANDLGQEKQQVIELNGKVEKLNEQIKLSEDKQKQVIESEEQHKKQTISLNEQITQLTEQLEVSAEKQKQASTSADEQQQVTIKALNKEQDALIAIIATHKEKEFANEEALKKNNNEADNTKQQIEKLTSELVTEKQKLDEQLKQLQTLKQENSEQDKNQSVATDKVSALESANSELQMQRDSLQVEQQKSNDKLQLVAKDYQEQISKLNDKQSVEEKRFITDSQLLKDSHVALETEKQTLQAQLRELQEKVDGNEADLANKQTSADQYQENLVSLEAQLKEAKSDYNNTQQRIDNAKAKFDSDSDQARETIKYLRDENHEITTKYEQRVGELEDKLTEFRLRFEYAQRQLAKNEG